MVCVFFFLVGGGHGPNSIQSQPLFSDEGSVSNIAFESHRDMRVLHRRFILHGDLDNLLMN
jgi:hypothetical protein